METSLYNEAFSKTYKLFFLENSEHCLIIVGSITTQPLVSHEGQTGLKMAVSLDGPSRRVKCRDQLLTAAECIVRYLA
jgi:hypothetical protein